MTDGVLDINRQWPELADLCLRLLKPNGTLFFSSNSRRLPFDPLKIAPQIDGRPVTVTDVTQKSIPEDFKAHRIHRCWEIRLGDI